MPAPTLGGSSTAWSSGTSTTPALPAGWQVGDLLLVFVTRRNAAYSGLSSAPAGWTELAYFSAGGDSPVRVFYRVAVDGQTAATFTSSSTTQPINGSLVAVRGATTAGLVAVDGGTGTGTTVTLPGVTTTGPALVLRYATAQDDLSASVPAGHTTVVDTNSALGSDALVDVWSLDVAAAGAVPAATSTLSGSLVWRALTVAVHGSSDAATGAGSQAPATGSGSGNAISTGTGDTAAAPATGAGSATAGGAVTDWSPWAGLSTAGAAAGTGAGSAAPATGAGSGTSGTTGTGAASTGPGTATGAATSTGPTSGTAAGTTSAATATGSGASGTAGGGAGTTSAPTATGEGGTTSGATGVASTGPATAAGEAHAGSGGTGAGTATPGQGSGSGDVRDALPAVDLAATALGPYVLDLTAHGPHAAALAGAGPRPLIAVSEGPHL